MSLTLRVTLSMFLVYRTIGRFGKRKLGNPRAIPFLKLGKL